jgi:hypothetical protein
MNPVI